MSIAYCRGSSKARQWHKSSTLRLPSSYLSGLYSSAAWRSSSTKFVLLQSEVVSKGRPVLVAPLRRRAVIALGAAVPPLEWACLLREKASPVVVQPLAVLPGAGPRGGAVVEPTLPAEEVPLAAEEANVPPVALLKVASPAGSDRQGAATSRPASRARGVTRRAASNSVTLRAALRAVSPVIGSSRGAEVA